MYQLKLFDPCDNNITFQPVFRTNPNHLPCARCGSTDQKVGAGKGPHSASLRCGKCESVALLRSADGFIKWTGKSELAKIQNQGGQW